MTDELKDHIRQAEFKEELKPNNASEGVIEALLGAGQEPRYEQYAENTRAGGPSAAYNGPCDGSVDARLHQDLSN